MRRSLTIKLFLVIAIMAMALPSEAKFLGDLGYLLFGGTRQYTKPGVTITLTGVVSATAVKHPAFSHQPINADEAMISKGADVVIDVIVLANRIDGREFVVAVSDPEKVVRAPDLKGRLPKSPLGGMQILGRFSGLYGQATWRTGSASPGVHFVYVFTYKGGEYQPQGETAIPIWVGPSLEDIERGGVDNLSVSELSDQGMETVKQPVSVPQPQPAPVTTTSTTTTTTTKPDGYVVSEERATIVNMTLVLSADRMKTKTIHLSVSSDFSNLNGDEAKKHYRFIFVSIPDKEGVSKEVVAIATIKGIKDTIVYAKVSWGEIKGHLSVILQSKEEETR